MKGLGQIKADEEALAKKPRGRDYQAISRGFHDVLKRISKAYMAPEQIRRAVEKPSHHLYGLSYEEALEMAYENIQAEATAATKGVRRP